MPPHRRHPLLAVLLASLVVIASGGCRGCFCSNATKALSQTAPPEAVKEQARKELEKTPAKLKTICGINVSGLKDMVLTVIKSEWAKHEVKIEGTAIPSSSSPSTAQDAGDDDDDDDDDDAGVSDASASAAADADAAAAVAAKTKIIVNPAKTILCIGVVTMTIDPVLDDKGNSTGWKTTSLEVESVQTAGVHFDKTRSGHHRRRHHHH